MKYVIGIDEVGRGPVAGPVTVCAFIAPVEINLIELFPSKTLKDSKKLSDKKRRELQTVFNSKKMKGEVDFVVSSKNADYIDAYGISKAVQACIQDCLNKLRLLNYPLDSKSTITHLDGALKIDSTYITKMRERFGIEIEYDVTIKGDEKIPAIACASIVAKVVRDNRMIYLSKKLYDMEGRCYGWDRNAGYGTKEHYELLEKFGVTEFHRKSFLKGLV